MITYHCQTDSITTVSSATTEEANPEQAEPNQHQDQPHGARVHADVKGQTGVRQRPEARGVCDARQLGEVGLDERHEQRRAEAQDTAQHEQGRAQQLQATARVYGGM